MRIQRAVVNRLRKAGDDLLFFKDGGALMGRDHDECTVDGSYPTDLGFLRIADALTPVLRQVLKL